MMAHLKTLPVYLALIVIFGYFSQAPSYNPSPDGKSLVLLSLSHYGERLEACRKLTAKEIAELPMNMKRQTSCSRERMPIRVELDVGGVTLFAEDVAPTGLGNDGPSVLYEKFWVEPGDHKITIRVRDTRDAKGFNWLQDKQFTLKAYDQIVVDFHPETGPWFR